MSVLPLRGAWISVSNRQGMSPEIVVRRASRPEGPWSEPTAAPECDASRQARGTESPAVVSTEPARGTGCRISLLALRRLRHRTGKQAVCARRGRRARAYTSLYGFAVHALKSSADTFGILRMNATTDQI